MNKFRMRIMIFTILATGSGLVSGCATGGAPSHNQAGVGQNIETGIVIDVHNVMMDGETKGTPAGVPKAGSSSGATLAAIAGGTLGAVAGREIEQIMIRQEGYEIFIRLDSGQVLSIVQPMRLYEPMIGDPVLISDERVRINPKYE